MKISPNMGIAAALAMMLPLAGCIKRDGPTAATDTLRVHDTVTVGSSKFFQCWIDSKGGLAYLFSDPVADTGASSVSAGWGNHVHPFPFKGYSGFAATFVLMVDTVAYPGGATFGDTAVTVQLASNVGNSSGSIQVPDSSDFTRPRQLDTLAMGTGIHCSWRPAQRIDWYLVWYTATAVDSAGRRLALARRDTFTADTSLTIPRWYLNVSDTKYYEVRLYLRPYRGPMPAPGAPANMDGDIRGYLVAQGIGDARFFFVGSPRPKEPFRHPLNDGFDREELMRKYLDGITAPR